MSGLRLSNLNKETTYLLTYLSSVIYGILLYILIFWPVTSLAILLLGNEK